MPAHDFQAVPMAVGATGVESGYGKGFTTISAAGLDRHPFKGERGIAGDGILAEKVKIELHAVTYDARHVTDHQIDPGYPFRLVVLGMFQCDVEYALGDGKFVHSVPIYIIPFLVGRFKVWLFEGLD